VETRILAVGADEGTMNTLTRELSHCELITASGPEGLSIARRSRPDIVLLGLGSGEGIEKSLQIRADLAAGAPPVVMLAGPDQREAISHGIRLGVDDFLLTPLEPRELRARVRALVESRQLRRDAAGARRHWPLIVRSFHSALTASLRDVRSDLGRVERLSAGVGSPQIVNRIHGALVRIEELAVGLQDLHDWSWSRLDLVETFRTAARLAGGALANSLVWLEMDALQGPAPIRGQRAGLLQAFLSMILEMGRGLPKDGTITATLKLREHDMVLTVAPSRTRGEQPVPATGVPPPADRMAWLVGVQSTLLEHGGSLLSGFTNPDHPIGLIFPIHRP
jgi:CheY-like chemotaxis protein